MKDPTEQIRERIDKIRTALEVGAEPATFDDLIAGLHPADLAEIIDGLDEDVRGALFQRIPAELRAETLVEVEEEALPALLEQVDEAEVKALFEELEVDDAADILAELPPEEAEHILEEIEPEESREIAALMKYDAESAGGVMTTDLVSVPVEMTADEAIVSVRQQGREMHDFHTVYVVDDDHHLAGTLTLRDLIIATGDARLSDIMRTDEASVLPTLDQEEVARMIAKYNLVEIPVVDEFERLVGRITVDDVIDIIEAETTEDILRMSGVDEEEETYASPFEIIRSRFPWLMITLAASGIGAFVVAQFEETIQRLAFIAVFMPVVAAMAGNSAVQASTVAVRRLALAKKPVKPMRSVIREVTAGLVIGFVVAVIIGSAGGVWRGSMIVALVVGGSMWLSISLGVLWGAAFPLVLDRMGFDPAVSSSVFLLTLTDTISFLLILGSASFFLVTLL